MDSQLQYLLDRTAISETIVRYFNSLDARDWPAMRATLADTTDLDFSQLFGDPRAVLDSDDFTAYAVTVLSGFRATQHISANHVITIDGDRARALAAMSAWHRADMDPGVVDTFMLRGRYDIGMVRVGDAWRMDKLHMTVWDEEGNKAVFEAAERAWDARVAAGLPAEIS